MLYFIATPIGNLKDISYRAVEVLGEVDIIACEDTRNSAKLLNHYNIKKRTIAYHKFNEQNSADGIIALLKQGKNIAVISDSGMPIISDPGSVLVDKLKLNNLPYTVIPGANAALCALILSGITCDKFTFIGFLPEHSRDKKKLLNEIKDIKTTLVLYVAPHNVMADALILFEHLGERKACFVNEITKLYEKTFNFVLGQQIDFEPRGEYVLIVEGAKTAQRDLSLSIEDQLKILLSDGMTKNDAIKTVAKENNMQKNSVYQIALNIFK